jgi:hypothetical protein
MHMMQCRYQVQCAYYYTYRLYYITMCITIRTKVSQIGFFTLSWCRVHTCTWFIVPVSNILMGFYLLSNGTFYETDLELYFRVHSKWFGRLEVCFSIFCLFKLRWWFWKLKKVRFSFKPQMQLGAQNLKIWFLLWSEHRNSSNLEPFVGKFCSVKMHMGFLPCLEWHE